jgi:hypothetical protein
VRFNEHSKLAGQHAFLSASKHHWVNYDDEKLDKVYMASVAAQRGTELHQLAYDLIRLGVKLPTSKRTLNMYVNDALGYKMKPEQVLYYSENCFGTPDAISFRKNTLRIHDLKTGVTLTSEKQLEVYAALFCLEYKYKPFDITIELRIYQNDEVRIYDVDPTVITYIMDKIISFDKRIAAIRQEESL